jgi:hypothetical protein
MKETLILWMALFFQLIPFDSFVEVVGKEMSAIWRISMNLKLTDIGLEGKE